MQFKRILAKTVLFLLVSSLVMAVVPAVKIQPLGFELEGQSIAYAGFELGDSPAWSGTGAANASDTAKAATAGLDPGGSASDTAVNAAGEKPNSKRQSP